MNLTLMKLKRCLRRTPRAAATRFAEPIFSSGQILTFAASVIGLALYLRLGASPQQRDVLATQWAIAIEAFAIALVGWAVLSLAVAPFIVIRDDKRKGRWDGHHFIYRPPLLVATERFEATDGNTQRRQIRFKDAEPNAFVYFTIELTPKATGLVGVLLTGGSPPEDVELDERWITPSGEQYIGTRLPPNRRATMLARLKPETVPVIVRIWCHSFFVGKDDKIV